jgi:hypothetical protein
LGTAKIGWYLIGQGCLNGRDGYGRGTLPRLFGKVRLTGFGSLRVEYPDRNELDGNPDAPIGCGQLEQRALVPHLGP